MGEATVAGVSETVKVKLEPYSLLDLYSDGVFVAGHGLDAEFKNKAEGLAAHGNIYVGDKWSAEGNGGKVSIYMKCMKVSCCDSQTTRCEAAC